MQMTDNDLLLAIGDIMDKKIKATVQPLQNSLDRLEQRVTRIEVGLLENNIIPRLTNIEQHYVLTADRYVDRTEAIDTMQSDISILKEIAKVHSAKLNDIA